MMSLRMVKYMHLMVIQQTFNVGNNNVGGGKPSYNNNGSGGGCKEPFNLFDLFG